MTRPGRPHQKHLDSWPKPANSHHFLGVFPLSTKPPSLRNQEPPAALELQREGREQCQHLHGSSTTLFAALSAE